VLPSVSGEKEKEMGKPEHRTLLSGSSPFDNEWRAFVHSKPLSTPWGGETLLSLLELTLTEEVTDNHSQSGKSGEAGYCGE
jgi:hypothetical protein